MVEKVGSKAKEVKAAVAGLFDADEKERNRSFKFGGVPNTKLKNKAATKARKGINPFTKEPCVIKAKPASKKVRCIPMKKLKEMVN